MFHMLHEITIYCWLIIFRESIEDPHEQIRTCLRAPLKMTFDFVLERHQMNVGVSGEQKTFADSIWPARKRSHSAIPGGQPQSEIIEEVFSVATRRCPNIMNRKKPNRQNGWAEETFGELESSQHFQREKDISCFQLENMRMSKRFSTLLKNCERLLC